MYGTKKWQMVSIATYIIFKPTLWKEVGLAEFKEMSLVIDNNYDKVIIIEKLPKYWNENQI